MNHNIGTFIAAKRKELGITQQKLAEQLNVSFQTVSKWENGTTVPDTLLLSQLASVLKTSVDTILGYKTVPITEYEKKYESQEYYWGLTPNSLCYEIMKLKSPVKPYKVLDIGCGEFSRIDADMQCYCLIIMYIHYDQDFGNIRFSTEKNPSSTKFAQNRYL